MHKQNGYLILALLSDIELYYSSQFLDGSGNITLQGEEFHHAKNVMRNSVGDFIYVTDGEGRICKTEIIEISKTDLKAVIVDKFVYENNAANICFCIPILKNPDRLKFALEKSVELGITNFILFTSKNTISKKINLEKFLRITLAAMKQSLRSFLPKIIISELDEIMKYPGAKLILDQKANSTFDGNVDFNKSILFLFGPEGGFDENEVKAVGDEYRFSLTDKRLRSETAIIKTASLLNIH